MTLGPVSGFWCKCSVWAVDAPRETPAPSGVDQRVFVVADRADDRRGFPGHQRVGPHRCRVSVDLDDLVHRQMMPIVGNRRNELTQSFSALDWFTQLVMENPVFGKQVSPLVGIPGVDCVAVASQELTNLF